MKPIFINLFLVFKTLHLSIQWIIYGNISSGCKVKLWNHREQLSFLLLFGLKECMAYPNSFHIAGPCVESAHNGLLLEGEPLSKFSSVLI